MSPKFNAIIQSTLLDGSNLIVSKRIRVTLTTESIVVNIEKPKYNCCDFQSLRCGNATNIEFNHQHRLSYF